MARSKRTFSFLERRLQLTTCRAQDFDNYVENTFVFAKDQRLLGIGQGRSIRSPAVRDLANTFCKKQVGNASVAGFINSTTLPGEFRAEVRSCHQLLLGTKDDHVQGGWIDVVCREARSVTVEGYLAKGASLGLFAVLLLQGHCCQRNCQPGCSRRAT